MGENKKGGYQGAFPRLKFDDPVIFNGNKGVNLFSV